MCARTARRILAATGMTIAAGWGSWSIGRALVPDFRIAGPSMGPALPGATLRTSCRDCEFPIECAWETRNEAHFRLVCPNCGGRTAPVEIGKSPAVEFARLALDSRGSGGAIKRWDVVAIKRRKEESRLWVKRVVGLPGELIEIANGEVLINGDVPRKSLSQFRALAILVHDDNFRPTDSAYPPRWSSSPRSHWCPVAHGYHWKSTEHTLEVGDTLAYQHVEPHLPAATPHIIYDGYVFNQRMARELHAVRDLAIDFSLSLQGSCRLELVGPGIDWGMRVVFDAEQRLASVGTASNVLWQRRLPVGSGQLQCCVGSWDQSFHLQISPWSEVTLDADCLSPSPPAPAFSFTASGAGSITVANLRIYRDVYYFRHARGGTGGLRWKLKTDEYFVLGDNVPRSIDSRDPQVGPVSRTAITGRVKLVDSKSR